MHTIRRLAFALVLVPASLQAQFPPAATRNVKALPRDISVRALIDTMKSFTRALGVRCTYCHVGSEGMDLGQYDFVSDDKPAKVKARQMIAMVTAINGEYLSDLDNRRQPAIAVTCITCHRGVTEPRPVQQVVLSAYTAAGADSAITAYRALRTRYYGRAAFDFGEVPLVDVGDAIAESGKAADALRIYRLNTELLPGSGFAHRSLGGAALAAGDTASAIAAYEKALALNARDQQSIDVLAKIRH